MIASLLVSAILGAVLPEDLTHICMWANQEDQCIDAGFFVDQITDCGNPRPIDAYDGGSGLMIIDVAEPYPDYVLRYGWRSYNRRYFGSNQDALLVFAEAVETFDGAFGDGMEDCTVWNR